MAIPTEAERHRIERFQADLASGIRTILATLGCRGVGPALSPSDVCLAWANYKFRRIAVRPRQVLRSDTLKRASLPSDESAAIDAIEERASRGVDLYPHQSTTLLRPLTNDGLLADWHIQHLHLGLATGRQAAAPFVNRSGNILLVRVTDDAIYFLDCLPHGEDVEPPWWNIDLPETVHRNWPDSIAHLMLDDYEPKLSWEDHRKLRPTRGHGATFTTAVTTSDGTSYLLGGGMVTSGYSTTACDSANAVQNQVTQIALSRRDDEMLVVTGDHRELHLRVGPR